MRRTVPEIARDVTAALICFVALGNSTALAETLPETPLESECLIALNAPTSPVPAFEAMPAVSKWTKPPVTVDLRSNPRARQFRTALRNGAKSGPNFAGHYTIVGWGCGSSCLDWAVVDARTGAVHFEPRIEVVATNHVDDDATKITGINYEFNALRFRQDSALLVVLGAPSEDETKEGIGYYRWTGRSFKLLKFLPRDQACRRSH